jgi:hypothetical protein
MPSGSTNSRSRSFSDCPGGTQFPHSPAGVAVESTAICRAARIDLNFANSYKAMPNFI